MEYVMSWLVAWLDRNPHFDLLRDWFDDLDYSVAWIDLVREAADGRTSEVC